MAFFLIYFVVKISACVMLCLRFLCILCWFIRFICLHV